MPPLSHTGRRAAGKHPATLTVAGLVTAGLVAGSSLAIVPAVSVMAAPGTIEGTVFQDLDHNGLLDAGEPVVADIEVTAYDDAGAIADASTTDSTGRYALAVADGAATYRVEFVIPAGQSHLQSAPRPATPAGISNGSAVQFAAANGPVASGARGVDFGVAAPGTFCGSDPILAASCFTQTTGDRSGVATVPLSFTEHNDGNPGGGWSGGGTPQAGPTSEISNNTEIGAVYGLAWQASTNTLYQAAYMKRRTVLPGGTGAIWQTDVDVTTGAALGDPSLFVNLDDHFGPDTAGPNLHDGGVNDTAVVPLIGTTGFGDIEMSADDTTLYAMNLADKSIYAIPADGTALSSTTIAVWPTPTADGCTAADSRPFALGVDVERDGALFAGAVCSPILPWDGDGGYNPTLTLWEVDTTTGTFTTVLTTALEPRGGNAGEGGAAWGSGGWYAWTDDTSIHTWKTQHPQPIFSDITFDSVGPILGIRDRYADQMPGDGLDPNQQPWPRGEGDILRTCWVAGTLVMESGGACDTLTNGGGDTEFFWMDEPGDTDIELSSGGVVKIPGRNTLVSSAYDAVAYRDDGSGIDDNYMTGGLAQFDPLTGTYTGAYDYYRFGTAPPNGTFGKAAGMGEVEVLCDMAPIQVGDRVWLDLDADGVQDPSEPGLEGVDVTLRTTSGVIDTTTTDASGTYVFDDVARFTDHTIDFDPTGAIGVDGSTLLASPNDVDADWRDSDPVPSPTQGAVVSLAYTSGGPGSNAHQLDAGFFEYIDPFRIGNIVWFDADNSGGYDATEPPIEGVTVSVFPDVGDDGAFVPGVDDIGGPIVPATAGVDVTDADGIWYVDGLAPGSYFAAIASGQTATVGAASVSLDDYASSTGVAQNTSANDEDNVDDGAPLGSFVAVSAVVVLENPAPTSEADTGDAPGAAETAADLATADPYTDTNSDLTVDFGFTEPVRVGSTLFLDADNDGNYDNADTPIAGVIIELHDGAGTVLQTAETDADGHFFFGALPPGASVAVSVPTDQTAATAPSATDGLVPTLAVSNDITVDNVNHGAAAAGAVAETAVYVLDPFVAQTGETEGVGGADTEAAADIALGSASSDTNSYMTVDIGLTPTNLYRVGNRVWLDADDNGTLDAGEAPLADVLVQLLDATDTVIATTATDGIGSYEFVDLDAGIYSIRIPVDQSASASPNTLDFLRPSRPVVTDPEAALEDDGQNNGAVAAGALSRSGMFTLGDPGGNPFDASEPSTEPDDAGWPSGGTDQSDLTIDFGFFQPYRIGNLVWEDYDADGLAGPGEPGIGGVTVELWDANGLLASTTTNGDGQYVFTELPPSSAGSTGAAGYNVRIPKNQPVLTGLRPAAPLTDADTSVDNDNNAFVDGAISWTDGVFDLLDTTPTGETDGTTGTLIDDGVGFDDTASDLTVDFGFFRGERLGGQVWLDEGTGQNDGSFDADEVGVAGITVELWQGGVPGTGTLSDTTVTDVEGNYVFGNVDPASTYVVAIVDPADGRTNSIGSTNDTATGDNQDHGVGADEVVPPAGYIAVTSAIALAGPGNEPVGETDTVPAADDTEGDANAAGDFYPDASSNLQIDIGLIDVPTFRVGNLVWHDIDADGVAQRVEPGIANVDIALFNAIGTPVGTTTTDGQGKYEFTGLAAGDYYIEIALAQVALLEFQPDTTFDQTAEVDNNSDGAVVAATTVRSAVLSLGENGLNDEPVDETSRDDQPGIDDDNGDGGAIGDDRSDFSVDFGFYQLSLGNQVFLDLDDDRQYEPVDGDVGIDGVIVDLYDGTDALVDSTTTVAGGQYLFTALLDGATYTVEVRGSNFAPGAPLEGYFSSTGVTADLSQDGDDVGIDPADPFDAAYTVRSAAVVMNVGGEQSASNTPDDGLGIFPDNDAVTPDSNEDLTIDFGFHQAEIAGSLFIDADNSGDDNGGADLPVTDPVVIDLLDGSGSPVIGRDGSAITTTVDPDGTYSFAALPQGDYIVEVSTANFAAAGFLDGYESSQNAPAPDADNDVDGDDNGDPIGGEFSSSAVRSTVVTLTGGDEPAADAMPAPGVGDRSSNATVDFGVFEIPPVELGNIVFEDSNNNGVLDAGLGEVGVPGVTVELLSNAGSVLATTVTDGSGFYLFAALDPGAYAVRLPAASFASGAPLEGWRASTPSFPDELTDGQNDGATNLAGDIVSGPVVLTFDDEPTTEGDESPNDPNVPDSYSNLAIDFGIWPGLRLGNQVWLDEGLDTNGGALNLDNGEYDSADAGELPLVGVEVELWIDSDASGSFDPTLDTFVDSTFTDVDGNYEFDHLDEGVPYLVAISETGITGVSVQSSTGDTQAGDNVDHGIDLDPAVTGYHAATAPVVLTVGAAPTLESDGIDVVADGSAETEANATGTSFVDANSNLQLDLGFINVPLFRLGNLVWLDADNDGLAGDAIAEPGLSGVLVQLTSGSGVVLAETVTDPAGFYEFTNLVGGDYRIEIPRDQIAVTGDPLPFAIDPAALTDVRTSSTDEVDPNLDIDNNDNGAGTATSYRSGVVTLGDGSFQSEPGDLRFNGETNRVGGADDDAGQTAPRIVDERSNYTVDFGFYRLALGDTVWNDGDGDGVRDAGEPGLPGVTVELFDDLNNLIGIETTDAGGNYLFEGLLDDETHTVVVPASNFMATGALAGFRSSNGDDQTADLDDSDDGVDPSTGAPYSVSTGPVTLDAGSEPAVLGSTDPTIDLGFYSLSIGNQVWFDLDDSGTFDSGELPASGVRVDLLDATGNQVFDLDGTEVTELTDVDGAYLFTGLVDDATYIVEIAASNFDDGGPLEGWWSSTATNVGADGGDNGIDTVGTPGDIATYAIRSAPITVDAGTDPGADGDGAAPVDIDNDVDVDGNGAALRPDANENLLVDFGFTTAEVAGSVFIDADNGGTDDGGADAPVADGTIVNLLDAAGDPVLDQTSGSPVTTVTSAGQYVFSGLPNGTYVVELDDSNFVLGAALFNHVSSEGTGTPAPDADVDATDGDDNGDPVDASGAPFDNYELTSVRTSPVDLAAGTEPTGEAEGFSLGSDDSSDATVDLGLWPIPPFEIASQVWLDIDNSGDVNGETGVDGVLVSLLADDGEGTLEPALDILGDPVATQTTAGGGKVLFEGLSAGLYVVRIDETNFGGGGALDGFTASTGPLSSTDPNDDFNGNNDGTRTTDGVETGPIELVIAAEPVAEGETSPSGADDRFSNLTVDLGIVPLLTLSGDVFVDLDHSGDDNTAAGPADAPAPAGVVVSLLDGSGEAVLDDAGGPLTSITDADGDYRFSDIVEGDYIIEIGAENFATDGPLADFAASTGTSTQDDPNDGVDGDNNGTGAPGDDVTTGVAELRYAQEPTGGYIDDTVDIGIVPLLAIGDRVAEDVDNDGILDVGDAGLAAVVVELLDDSGSVLETTTTDADGAYLFDRLVPGTYRVHVPELNFEPEAVLARHAPSDGSWVSQVEDADENSDGLGDGAGVSSGDIVVAYASEVADDGYLNNTVDFGFYSLTVESAIWSDSDLNGRRDPDEGGVAGVVAQVLDPDGTPVIDPVTDDPIVAVADEDGVLSLGGIAEGNYIIEIVPSNFTSGGVLEGFASIVQTSLDPNDGIDGDDNGEEVDGGVRTRVMSLSLPPTPSPGGRLLESIDFGMVELGALSGTVFADLDRNGARDDGEAGVGGVGVRLYDDDGELLAVVVTEADGSYRFADTYPCTCRVGIDLSTVPGDLTGPVDVDAATGVMVASFSVVPGGEVTTADVGLLARTLPRTGSGLGRPLGLGTALTIAGLALALLSSRRRRVGPVVA